MHEEQWLLANKILKRNFSNVEMWLWDFWLDGGRLGDSHAETSIPAYNSSSSCSSSPLGLKPQKLSHAWRAYSDYLFKSNQLLLPSRISKFVDGLHDIQL